MKRSHTEAFHSNTKQQLLVTLNVGGTLFRTMEHTLRDSVHYFKNSLLGRMFMEENREMLIRDENGVIFLDADPIYFRSILNVLRYPLLIDELPSDMSVGVWVQQLEYWGLSERTELDEDSKRIKPLSEMSMKEISDKMKRDTMKDEEIVIKTILESTGYYERGGKSRKTLLHIPIGKCKLPWGSDLGETLKADHMHYEDLLRSQLKVNDVSIKDNHKKTLTYSFQGETYSITETKTMTISFIVVI